MNREIKFRVWFNETNIKPQMIYTHLDDFIRDEEDYVVGILILDTYFKKGMEICYDVVNGKENWLKDELGELSDIRYNADNSVLMQFTGFFDKNNKEIYEGDILQISYTSSYEIFDESGEFVAWSDDEKEFTRKYEIIWYSGDYEINLSEYTIGLNGWAAKLIEDTRKSTCDAIGSIRPLSAPCKTVNYGFYGLTANYCAVIGNIFETI